MRYFINLHSLYVLLVHLACIDSLFFNHSGLAAGEDNGQRGYLLTYVIAYIRVSYILFALLFTFVNQYLYFV